MQGRCHVCQFAVFPNGAEFAIGPHGFHDDPAELPGREPGLGDGGQLDLEPVEIQDHDWFSVLNRCSIIAASLGFNPVKSSEPKYKSNYL